MFIQEHNHGEFVQIDTVSELFLYEDVDGDKYNLNRNDIDKIIEDIRFSSKCYFIEPLGIDGYDFLVVGTSYLSALDEIDLIEKELSVDYDTNDAKLLFDGLLRNGMSDNRFLEVSLDSGKADMKNLKIAEHIPLYIRQITTNVINNHPSWIEHAPISSPLKFLIRKGKAL